MNKFIQILSLTVVTMSLGTLAACSKSDDTPAPPPASTSPAPAAPSGPAAPSAPATPPAPGASDPATPQQQSAPADQQSMGDKIKDAAAVAKDRASSAGSVIADKAGEMAHNAGVAANRARESVVDSAARADAAIQNAVGNGKKQ